uniref:Uncharacterized protein n=1 Tax=Oryza sativa subsp. japonica TaxID=39947 RepID=Q6H8A4_ORYSJ|nr:hypothetical protein [Oryza sativa Japonica Group]
MSPFFRRNLLKGFVLGVFSLVGLLFLGSVRQCQEQQHQRDDETGEFDEISWVSRQVAGIPTDVPLANADAI